MRIIRGLRALTEANCWWPMLPRTTDLGLAPKEYFTALKRALEQRPWQDPDIQWQGNGLRRLLYMAASPP